MKGKREFCVSTGTYRDSKLASEIDLALSVNYYFFKHIQPPGIQSILF